MIREIILPTHSKQHIAQNVRNTERRCIGTLNQGVHFIVIFQLSNVNSKMLVPNWLVLNCQIERTVNQVCNVVNILSAIDRLLVNT